MRIAEFGIKTYFTVNTRKQEVIFKVICSFVFFLLHNFLHRHRSNETQQIILCSSAQCTWHRMIDAPYWATISMSMCNLDFFCTIFRIDGKQIALKAMIASCDNEVKPLLIYDISLCNHIKLVFAYNSAQWCLYQWCICGCHSHF